MILRFTPFIARLQHSTSRPLFLEKTFTDGNLTDGDQNKTLIKKKDLQLESTEIQNTTGPHNQQHLL